VVVTERPWLTDKSALVRLGNRQEEELWAERTERGLVNVITITLAGGGIPGQIRRELRQDSRLRRT
jgi:hypothetical protein